MKQLSTSPAAGPSEIAPDPPFPFGVMLFVAIAVFLMPVIILLYAARTAAHHTQQDLPTAARHAIDQGHAIQAPYVIVPSNVTPSRP